MNAGRSPRRVYPGRRKKGDIDAELVERLDAGRTGKRSRRRVIDAAQHYHAEIFLPRQPFGRVQGITDRRNCVIVRYQLDQIFQRRTTIDENRLIRANVPGGMNASLPLGGGVTVGRAGKFVGRIALDLGGRDDMAAQISEQPRMVGDITPDGHFRYAEQRRRLFQMHDAPRRKRVGQGGDACFPAAGHGSSKL